MGNCLPFFSFLSGDDDDLTRLHNLGERRNGSDASGRNASSTSRRSSRSSSGSASSGENRQRYRRNLQPSSYVNELYVSASGAGDADSVTEAKVLDEKRKARVRALLEQLRVDRFQKGGQGDDECAICMLEFLADEPIRYLPCMHSYHVDCIDDWLLRSFTCPSCMEPVDSAILSAFTVNFADNCGGSSLSNLPCSAANLPFGSSSFKQ